MDSPIRNDLRRGSCGFTAIEIIVVVVILAIVAAMAVPMLSSAASMQVSSAANIIAADLEYAKSMAITRQQYYAVVFDALNERYWIEQGGNVIPHPVKKGFDYLMDFRNNSRLNKVDISNVNFDSFQKVEFDYLGSVYNGGGGPLNSGVIILQAGGHTMTINVAPVTGYVTIQ